MNPTLRHARRLFAWNHLGDVAMAAAWNFPVNEKRARAASTAGLPTDRR